MEYISTDGSLKGRRGGWAAIVRGDKKVDIGGGFECDDSYTAELTAIYKAASQAEGQFMIFTDHRGIANELNNMVFNDQWVAPEKEKIIWVELHEKAKDKLVGAFWQKRHATPELRQAHKIASEHAKTPPTRGGRNG